MWRIRLWPYDGITKAPAQMWDMPGFGIPENTPAPAPNEEQSAGGGSSATNLTTATSTTTAIDFDAHPELRGVLALRDFDDCAPDVAAAIVAMDPQTQRRLAQWAAVRAFEFAGLADRPWVTPALTALCRGEVLPAPFDDPQSASSRLAAENLPPEGRGGPYRPSTAPGEEKSPTARMFDHGPMHRPYSAMPALFGAADPRPIVAAFQSLSHACATYAEHVDTLLAATRTEFDILA
ncbi:hypothetical protein [Rhodococcus koreensis]